MYIKLAIEYLKESNYNLDKTIKVLESDYNFCKKEPRIYEAVKNEIINQSIKTNFLAKINS